MHLTRHTACRVSLLHTLVIAPTMIHDMDYYILDECIRSIQKNDRFLLITCDDMDKPVDLPLGVPLSVYSILFTYYDPGAEGFEDALVSDRPDIVMMYMRSQKPIHTTLIDYAYECDFEDIFDYAISNGMWIGSLDEVFHSVCKGGHRNDVIKLLPHVDIHCQDDRGLYLACYHNNISVIILLLSRGIYSGVTLSRCIQATQNQNVRSMLLKKKKGKVPRKIK